MDLWVLLAGMLPTAVPLTPLLCTMTGRVASLVLPDPSSSSALSQGETHQGPGLSSSRQNKNFLPVLEVCSVSKCCF